MQFLRKEDDGILDGLSGSARSEQSVSERKKELRIIFKEQRRALSEEEKRSFSEKLCKNILSLDVFKQADAVLSFYPLENETDVQGVNEEVLRLKKILAFPKCVKGTREMNFFSVSSFDELEKGSYSIYEPKETCPLYVPSESAKTICIAPAMAYSRDGYRIGYGGGYYDRYLSKFPFLTSVGVIYSPFLTDTLPCGELDIAVDTVVTDLEIIKIPK